MNELADGSPKQAVTDSQNEQLAIEISAEADAAMSGLKELFSDPALATRASFRCSTEGPDEIDVVIESLFGEEDSEYEQWVRRLYELGPISKIPPEWKT